MQLEPQIVWRIGGGKAAPLDVRLLPLLAAVRSHGTLSAAAGALGLPYRSAWGLLIDADARLGTKLVEMQRGRGAVLGESAVRLLAAHERACARLSDRDLRVAIAVPTAGNAPRRTPVRALRIVASHDPLLVAFCERIAAPQGIVASLAARGSLEALAAYTRNEAEVAGFHVAVPIDAAEAAPFRRALDVRRDRLIRFATREQGLIIAKGNPRELRSLADVARARVRFVNRQSGSGTRLLIDQLLREARIAPATIRGYSTEEYTHDAVAAMVAAGHADCAFGVKAAAAQFRLGFVPLRTEVYWLAVRAKQLESAPMRQLRAALESDELARLARSLSGYSIREAGTVASVPAAFG